MQMALASTELTITRDNLAPLLEFVDSFLAVRRVYDSISDRPSPIYP